MITRRGSITKLVTSLVLAANVVLLLALPYFVRRECRQTAILATSLPNTTEALSLPQAQSPSQKPAILKATPASRLQALAVAREAPLDSDGLVKPESPPSAELCDSYEEVNLGPREDAHCSEQADGTDAGLQRVFECRKKEAKEAVEKACANLPGLESKPFGVANMVLSVFNVEGRSPKDSFLRMYVEPQSDIVSDDLLHNGGWERHEASLVLSGLHLVESQHGVKDPVLLDIGANVGAFTFAAAAFGYEVIAFEAMERNVHAMYMTMCANPWLRDVVTLFPYGLSDREETCHMWSAKLNVGDGHMFCNAEQNRRATYECMLHRGAIHTVKLGDYLAGGVPAHVMKMDVEGREPGILRGAGDVLAKQVHYAVSEVNSFDLPKKNDGTLEDIVHEYLSAYQEAHFTLHAQSFTSPEVSIEDVQRDVLSRQIMNIFAVKTRSF